MALSKQIYPISEQSLQKAIYVHTFIDFGIWIWCVEMIWIYLCGALNKMYGYVTKYLSAFVCSSLIWNLFLLPPVEKLLQNNS